MSSDVVDNCRNERIKTQISIFFALIKLFKWLTIVGQAIKSK